MFSFSGSRTPSGERLVLHDIQVFYVGEKVQMRAWVINSMVCCVQNHNYLHDLMCKKMDYEHTFFYDFIASNQIQLRHTQLLESY